MQGRGDAGRSEAGRGARRLADRAACSRGPSAGSDTGSRGPSAGSDTGSRRPSVASDAIVLVGFMGSGKSHVGALLARLLKLPLVDSDGLVVEELGPIETVFAEQGERVFREAERRVVLEALGRLQDEPAVVSLGGGAVSDGDVRAALRAVPHVAWLSAPVDVLWSRVRRAARRGRGSRPLARDEASFRSLYEQRLPLYREVATIEVLNDGGRSAAEIAEGLVRQVRGETP